VNVVTVEDKIKTLLNQYYFSFSKYPERKEEHKRRLEISQKLNEFVKNDLPLIIKNLDDESQYQKVYEIFDLIAINSWQAGRQHYLSFFGAKRYYLYSGKKEEPPSDISKKFPGTMIKENIKKLHNLLTAAPSELPKHFESFMDMNFIGWNLTTAFLMYLNPQKFILINEKTLSLLDKIGVKRPSKKSYDEYQRLLDAFNKVKECSMNYADDGFKDFMDLDWFTHLLAVGELEEHHSHGFEGFVEEDFKRCTGSKRNAKYLQNKFKRLMEAIRPLLPPILVDKLWVPRINIRGRKEYRKSMWVGTSHPKYANPRLGIQFQFYIYKNSFFAGIWGEEPARKARREVSERIKSNSERFLELVKKLPSDYTLDLFNDVNAIYKVSEFNEDMLREFVDRAPKEGIFFTIGKWLTPEEAISKREKIVDFCIGVVNNLLPIYLFIIGEEQEREVPITTIEKVSYAHLLAGKNLVLYGPPGTGKTRQAIELANRFCKGNYLLRTANAEWNTYDVIGGVCFSEGSKENSERALITLGFRKGFLTEVAERSEKNQPCWLIIDEINRANLDFSFGKAFTLLDVDYRKENPLIDKDEFPGVTNPISLPENFRIIATMNSYDKAILFSLGYAFRRRFAFVEIPSPFKTQNLKYDVNDQVKQNWQLEVSKLVKGETYFSIEREIESWIHGFSENQRVLFSNFPHFESNLHEIYGVFKIGKLDPYNPMDMLYRLAEEITKNGLVEFGYAQVVDAIRFVLAYLATERSLSYNPENIVEAVDHAFLAYFMPQFEYILPDLRRETISGEVPNIKNILEGIIKNLEKLGLRRSMDKVRKLLEEHKSF